MTTELKSLLDEVADRARTYDVVERAALRGRRRRRRRQLMAAGSAVAAVLALATAVGVIVGGPASDPRPRVGASSAPDATTPGQVGPPFPARCTAQRLPIPDGYPHKAVVSGGDPTGRFLVGRAYLRGGGHTMLIWDNGSVRTVDMAGEDADLYDVNSSGDAVGYSYVTPEQTAAFAYVDGTMTRLAGVNAMATQIGENGAIVGSIGTGGNAWTTVVWRSPSAQPEPLPQPTGLSNASAVAIDTDGTIIGSARGGRGQDVPVLWRPDGTVLTLAWPRAAHPDGSSPGSIGFIGGVHDGWVAVELRDFLIDGRDHAQDDWYTWNIHTGQTRELDVAPELVNAQGWVVAHALDAWLVLDSERGRVTLSTLPGVADAPLTSAQVTSLSDDGRTIGGSFARLTASFGDDDNIPVVWRCS